MPQSTTGAARIGSIRFSLSFVLTLVAFLAISCAALTNASQLWASITVTATIVVLLLAIAGGIFLTLASRAFWIGVCVFGWIYLLLGFWPPYAASDTGGRRVSDHLLTTTVSKQLYIRVFRERQELPGDAPVRQATGGAFAFGFGSGGGAASASSGAFFSYELHETWLSFMLVAHCLWTLLIAFVGGVACRQLYLIDNSPM